MLRELHIHNVAIIEDVTVEFGPGLNVLSGETGAGKSIILGALGLILGSRASSDLVRTGMEAAEVRAHFDLDDAARDALAEIGVDPDPDDEGLLIRRVLTSNGRSRAYVAGVAIPLASLRTVAGVLVDYASQHEHRVLLDEARHRNIVDRFGDYDDLLAAVGVAVKTLRELDHERATLRAREDDQRARLDFLEYQLGELDAFKPVLGEEAALDRERIVLANAANLAELARGSERALYSGSSSAVEQLGNAQRSLRELVGTDETLAPLLDAVNEALFAVEDAARDLRGYASKTQQNPGRLADLDERLAALSQLTRKHRTHADGLVALQQALRSEAETLGTLDMRLHELDREVEAARGAARSLCTELTTKRHAAGKALSALVEKELETLAMPRARLLVGMSPQGEGDGVALGEHGPYALSHGADVVALLLSANLGEEPRPLARVASGGELSRILLAVRRALADTRSVQVQVCVFDEIDSGLGGATAESVAEKLVAIAKSSQVLAITHLPHIAAAGAAHFRVEKTVEQGRTRTNVRRLDGDHRVQELVRMVAGTGATEAAASFARELLSHDGRL